MAIHKPRKPGEAMPGRWFPFAEDPDHGDVAEVYFVPLERDEFAELRKEYEAETPIRVKGKLRYQIGIPEDRAEEFTSAIMERMWKKCAHFRVIVDADSVPLFRRCIDSNIVEGQEVALDGNLSSEIKVWCVKAVEGFANFALKIITQLHDRDPGEGRLDSPEERREKALSQNLATGSSSGSPTGSSPTTEKSATPAQSLEETTSRALEKAG